MNIRKKLDLWEKEGLLDAGCKKAIADFEERQGRGKLMPLITGLGMFCIGLGLISIVAANWQIIPAAVKLTAYFFLLAANAAAIFKTRGNLREGLLIGYSLLLFAGIGLAAQIFQLQPHGLTAYFFWALLSLPLLTVTHKKILSFCWFPIALAAVADAADIYQWPFFRQLTENMPAGLLLLIAVCCGWLYAGLSLLNRTLIADAAKFWMTAAAVTALVIADADAGDFYLLHREPLYLVKAFLAAAAVLPLFYFHYRRDRLYFGGGLILLCGIILVSFIPLPLSGFILTMTALAYLMFGAWKQGRTKLMNTAAVFAALRLLIAYWQVFGSLTQTGLGLLGGGILTLGLGYLIKRLNQKTEA